MKKILAAVCFVLALQAGSHAFAGKALKAPARKVVVTYLHGDARCSNCLKIEAFSKEAMEKHFAREMKKGTVEWRVINFEEAGNEHYFTDYKLFTKSVVVTEVKDGKEIRFQNLEKVWQHLGDKAAFIKYVRAQVNGYLRGGK